MRKAPKRLTPSAGHKLLIEQPPLQVLPELAIHLGLNEAIFLQQLHYWLRESKNLEDGYQWVYNSLTGWKSNHFPFWSEKTIQRIITVLKNLDILIIGNYNKFKGDRTLWYRINYEALDQVIADRIGKLPSGQNDQMVWSECPDQEDKMTRPLPKTTAKITTNTTPLPPKRKRGNKVVVADDEMIKTIEACFLEGNIKSGKPADTTRIAEVMALFGRTAEEAKNYIRWTAYVYSNKCMDDITGFLYRRAEGGMQEPAGYVSPEQIAANQESNKCAQNAASEKAKAAANEEQAIIAEAKALLDRMPKGQRQVWENKASKKGFTKPSVRRDFILASIVSELKSKEKTING
jgi:hypothetical protein